MSDTGLAAVCTLPNLRILDASNLPLVSLKGLATLRWARLLWKVDLTGFAANAEFSTIVDQLRRWRPRVAVARVRGASLTLVASRNVRVLPRAQ